MISIEAVTTKATWAVMLVALASVTPHSTYGLDGFEGISLREVGRFLGIGTGPGYHNKPCQPRQAVQFNNMLEGSRNPGWLAWKRSQLSCRVPQAHGQFYFPGEDGTPDCLTCAAGAVGQAWNANQQPMDYSPMENMLESGAGEPTPAQKSPGDSLYGPETSSDIGANVRELLRLRKENDENAKEDSPFKLQPNDGDTDNAAPTDRRSIEELLEGVGAGKSGDKTMDGTESNRATFDDYIPGEELWNRLSPETRKLFEREFPREKLPSNQPPNNAPQKPRPDGNRSSSFDSSQGAWW